MSEPKVAIEWRPHIPAGFDGPADTPLEALIRGQNVLFEEDKWVKQAWFNNEHPEVDPEDPFCNDWQVCAAGAVLMVTVGAARQTTRIKWKARDEVGEDDVVVEARHEGLSDPESFVKVSCPIPKERQTWGIIWADERDDAEQPEGTEVYKQALEFLAVGASVVSGRHFGDVPSFNDSSWTTRTDVLKAFSKAIALAAEAQGSATATKTITQALVDNITADVDVEPEVVV
jgi:hypothetical protein